MSKPLSRVLDKPNDNLCDSRYLGAGGESNADPNARPMYITGNEKGLPPLPGITRLAVDAYDNAGYEGD